MAGGSRFISSLQKIVLLNNLIAFIFTILLLIENRSEIIQDWGLASVIFYIRVYYNVIATGRAGMNLILNPLLHYKMASLLCCFSSPFAIQSLGLP